MKKKLTSVAFHGTKEQEDKLRAVIADYRDVPGCMMPILQQTQEIYGYLPMEAMKLIAAETDTSVEEIFGIASFYSQFKLNPNGKYAISVCLGTACYVKGSGQIMERLERELGMSPLHRRVRPGAGSHGQRRCVRPSHGRGCARHSCQI